jgi:hypothetical protein
MQKETESLLLPFELTKNLSWAILITRKAQIQTRPTDPI